jgi:hypothetical protein
LEYERHIGQHFVRVGDDDLMVMKYRGPVSVAEATELIGIHDEKLAADGDLYVLADLLELGTVTPEARHVAGARPKSLPGYCVAYVVVDFRMKLLMGVFLRAVSLLTPSKIVHRFFDEQESARAWLREMREQRRPAGRKTH